MKRLLTFIYGLLLLSLGLLCEYKFHSVTEWYRWMYFALIFINVLAGFEKLNKSIE